MVPLSVCFRAACVLWRIVGWWRDGWDKLLKVHDVGEEGILRSGAFWVDWTRAMWGQLSRENSTRIMIIKQRDVICYNICTKSFLKYAAVWFIAECLSFVKRKKVASLVNVKYAVSVLTRCTRSRENMWILQVTVDRVQMMVERMLRPHALNKRSFKRNTHSENLNLTTEIGGNMSYLKDSFTIFQACFVCPCLH